MIAELPDPLLTDLANDWMVSIAREDQVQPLTDKLIWLCSCGRGWGKTRTGSGAVHFWAEQGEKARMNLVARTASDVRDVMIEGPAGILKTANPENPVVWQPALRKLTWRSGAIAHAYSAEEPDVFRGPECSHIWCDELAAWKYPADSWDNLMFDWRIGDDPRCIITTTARPISTFKGLLDRDDVYVTRGNSYDNRDNLTDAYYANIIKPYEGTRKGRQEIYSDLLEESEGALWKRSVLEDSRRALPPDNELRRVVVAIDPAVTSTETSDETGIVACARSGDGHGYVLADASGRYTPAQWASKAIELFHSLRADRIIGEANNGGDMIEHTLRTIDRTIPYTKVHASRGKAARAEPVAARYEQGTMHHPQSFPELEDQLCNWDPLSNEKSPDRLDALVWAMTHLHAKVAFFCAG